MASAKRNYWVVSPNVKNNNNTVEEWKQASIETHAAFMGWYPDDYRGMRMGPKFAGKVPDGVKLGDVILIARRTRRTPEIVGFGVVDDEARTTLPGFVPPGRSDFGSLRRLRPFVADSRPPTSVPIDSAVSHVMALARLHPDRNPAHKKVCQWMERRLKRLPSRAGSPRVTRRGNRPAVNRGTGISVVTSPKNHQLDYVFQTKASIREAQKTEAILLTRYGDWLAAKGRKLEAARFGKLQCDGYERARRNLIEAKSSVRREYIRMAVGQLLDYAFQGKGRLGELNKAILLPKRPSKDVQEWLASLGIKLIWRDGDAFVDNANGKFT